jgi:hypothetical protein
MAEGRDSGVGDILAADTRLVYAEPRNADDELERLPGVLDEESSFR